MKYKALMLDMDGTLIPIADDAIPSKKVLNALKRASSHVSIGLATSRPYHYMKHIFDYFDFSAPCIINGGAEILDPKIKEILAKEYIAEPDLQKAIAIAGTMGLEVIVDFHDKSVSSKECDTLRDATTAFIYPVVKTVAETFMERLRTIPTLTTHPMVSAQSGYVYVSINSGRATKQEGILTVAEFLRITTHEIIGIGDGANDLPLLMACGLKVAMGNAVDDLKAIADYIAPTAEEDGIAEVIERFILS